MLDDIEINLKANIGYNMKVICLFIIFIDNLLIFYNKLIIYSNNFLIIINTKI